MRISKAEKLHRALPGENVWSGHIERSDLVKRIKDGIREIQTDEIPVRIDLLHLRSKVRNIVLGAAALRSECGAKIVNQKETSPFQILAKIDNVLRKQVQVTGLAQIRKRIL